MGPFAAGQVVVLPFPYSDLSGQKLRPVLLLASAGYDDWVISQITSNPFSDPFAVQLTEKEFSSGGLGHTSYVRPAKLFTAHSSLIAANRGALRPRVFEEIREAVIAVFR
jgi:mRNA interferase MazF